MFENKIIFTGYYGAENTGDDMFGLVACWGSEYYWKNTDSSLLSHLGSSSNDIKITYSLSKRSYFKGYHVLQSFFKIIFSKYMVLAGGSILHSKHKNISPRSFMFFLSKFKLIKIGAIGVSLGPFKSDKDYQYISRVLNKFRFLVLRDRASYEIAIKMNLPYKPVLGADLAFLLPETIKDLKSSLKNKYNDTQKLLGVSLCHYEKYSSKNQKNEQRREHQIFKVLSELKNHIDIKFRFFVINGNSISGDAEFTYSFIKKLALKTDRYEVIQYNVDTLQTVADINDCSAMFSVRLHGAIFAASQNVPSLLVEYHKKCGDYLDDIGVLNQWRIGDMELTVSEVVKKINLLLNKQLDNFYTKRGELLNLAKKNFLDESVLKEMKNNE